MCGLRITPFLYNSGGMPRYSSANAVNLSATILFTSKIFAIVLSFLPSERRPRLRVVATALSPLYLKHSCRHRRICSRKPVQVVSPRPCDRLPGPCGCGWELGCGKVKDFSIAQGRDSPSYSAFSTTLPSLYSNPSLSAICRFTSSLSESALRYCKNAAFVSLPRTPLA